MPGPTGPAPLPHVRPDNATPFSGWPDGATVLSVEDLIAVRVRLQYPDLEVRRGALAKGWHGSQVLVTVPTRGTWWFAGADVERERFDL